MRRRCALWGACVIALGACGAQEVLEVAGAGEEPVGFAVVCSDYVSSQVALMGPDGLSLAADALIHSGSQRANIALSLSGDVVLPSVHSSGDQALLIDRTHGVLTWVDLQSAAVTRQLVTADSFAANPHDVNERDDGSVLVTRYGSQAGHDGLGDDVAVFDADGSLRQRITFPVQPGVAARPDRMVPFGEDLIVSLNHGAADYSGWEAGRYARLRSTQGEWAVEQDWLVPELSNCGGLAVHGNAVALVCTGDFDGGQPVGDASGVLLTDASGQETARLLGSDLRVGGAFAPAVALRDGAVWLVRFGEQGGRGDQVLRWSPGDDQVETLLEVEDAFAIDALAASPGAGLLVPVGAPEDPRLCAWNSEGWLCGVVCSESGLPPRSLLAFDEPG